MFKNKPNAPKNGTSVLYGTFFPRRVNSSPDNNLSAPLTTEIREHSQEEIKAELATSEALLTQTIATIAETKTRIKKLKIRVENLRAEKEKQDMNRLLALGTLDKLTILHDEVAALSLSNAKAVLKKLAPLAANTLHELYNATDAIIDKSMAAIVPVVPSAETKSEKPEIEETAYVEAEDADLAKPDTPKTSTYTIQNLSHHFKDEKPGKASDAPNAAAKLHHMADKFLEKGAVVIGAIKKKIGNESSQHEMLSESLISPEDKFAETPDTDTTSADPQLPLQESPLFNRSEFEQVQTDYHTAAQEYDDAIAMLDELERQKAMLVLDVERLKSDISEGLTASTSPRLVDSPSSFRA